MTTKIDFKPFYVPANLSETWVDKFIPYTMGPLIPQSSFMIGLQVDTQGLASVLRSYQYLTEKDSRQEKIHNLQDKILQGRHDVESFKMIDPERVWEVREAIIRDIVQDCGDVSQARQLVNKYIPLSNEYFELGHQLHVIEPHKMAVIKKMFVQPFMFGVLSQEEWTTRSQNPSVKKVPLSYAAEKDWTVADLIDGIEVCTITSDDRELEILKGKAAQGNIDAKSQLLVKNALKMPKTLPQPSMHIITPAPGGHLLQQSVNKVSFKTAAIKAQNDTILALKTQMSPDQLTINASDVVGGAIGATAVRYVQGELPASEAVKEVVIQSGKSVVANVVVNVAGDASRSVLENFISADKIPGAASTMRVMTVGKAILTAPTVKEAAKKGTDAAANCAIQYAASILVPAVAPSLGTTVGTVVGSSVAVAVGVVAAPAVAATVGATIGTVAAIGTVSFCVGSIGTAGIFAKNYVISKVL